jgi:hypothetical protein
VTNRSLMGSVGALLLATCFASGSLVGCSKKKDEDAKAQAEKSEEKHKRPQGDRYADGKRLESVVADWQKRWSETAELPDCEPLLKDKAELELCKTSAAALASMKAAAAKPEPEAGLLHAAAELALATENASEKLRMASMAKMQAEHAAAPVGSSGAPAAKLAPGAPSAGAKPKALAIAKPLASSKLIDKLKPAADAPPLDPAMQVMQAYSRVNRASLRYLSQFLQFGALPTRRAAFTELEALSKKKEPWPSLGRTLREAAMAENDPDLQDKLKALAPKLSRRPPSALGIPGAAPGMPPGMPPGHPPTEPAAAPPVEK